MSSIFGKEIDPDYVPGVKLGLHSFQIIFSFILWCLEVAVFVDKTTTVNSNNGWTFAVVCVFCGPCCLSLHLNVEIIYLPLLFLIVLFFVLFCIR
jgi:hypothetical protein